MKNHNSQESIESEADNAAKEKMGRSQDPPKKKLEKKDKDN